jgi:hypothetical protein
MNFDKRSKMIIILSLLTKGVILYEAAGEVSNKNLASNHRIP